MKNGALPTESVAQVFKTAGLLDRFERFKKGEAVETLLQEAAKPPPSAPHRPRRARTSIPNSGSACAARPRAHRSS